MVFARRAVRSHLFPFCFMACVLWSTLADAAILTVNSTNDATDAVPGNGVCESAAGSGTCTLRAAIQEANAVGGVNSIFLPAGTFVLTRTGAGEDNAVNGDLDVRSGMSIIGAGSGSTIIDGNNTDRIFDVIAGGISLTGMTLRNGRREGSITDASTSGGAVRTRGTMSATDVVFSNNFASLDGGAIYTDSDLTLSNVTLEQNAAGVDGGAIAAYGGSLYIHVSIQDSAAINNSAGFNGGGVYCSHCVVSLVSSLFRANMAITGEGSGGGIYGYSAVVGVTGSTLSGNRARVSGGGIGGVSTAINIGNSTISGNGVGNMDRRGGSGGGIFGSSSTIGLYNCTMAENVAGTGGAISMGGGGITTVTLANSIIGHNLSGYPYSDIYAQVDSKGYNLLTRYRSIYTGAASTGNANDIIGQDPLLAALADNGGTTPTHALLHGSPAIDAGNPGGCTIDGGASLTKDQQGTTRKDGNQDGTFRCDIGAFEYTFAAGFEISSAGGLVTSERGTTATFNVRLNKAPSAAVELALTSSDTGEGSVAPANLVFDAGNWNVWQTVTVTGQDDTDSDGSGAYSIITGDATSGDPEFSGLNPVDIAVTNYDDEGTAVIITPGHTLTTSESGSSASFTVSLTAPPVSDVAVRFDIGDATEGTFGRVVQPDGSVSDGTYTTVVFTPENWFMSRGLSVEPVSDGVADGKITYEVAVTVSSTDASYAAVTVAPLKVANADEDAGGGSGGGGGGGAFFAAGADGAFTAALLVLWRRKRNMGKAVTGRR